MIKANTIIKMNQTRIKALTSASITALEQTAEVLHTEVVQAQVIPFDTGNLQNESMFVDTSESAQGFATLVHSTPYARRLYYHPEYDFSTLENARAGGTWFKDWLPGGREAGFAAKTFKELYRKAGDL